jgi:hypothetical protein
MSNTYTIRSTKERRHLPSKLILANFGIFAVVFLSSCTSQNPAEAWLHTARNGLWSREEIIKPLLEQTNIEGKPRAEVLRILGTPDISEKIITEEKENAARNDSYQLSFLNTNSLDIEYDGNDVVKRHSYGPGCLANYYPGSENPAKPVGDVRGNASTATGTTSAAALSARKQIASNLLQLEEGKIEQLWGPPDMAEVDVIPSFPTPLRSSYYSWRVSPLVYNLAETEGAYNVAPSRRRILSLVTISLGPDCPVRRAPLTKPVTK